LLWHKLLDEMAQSVGLHTYMTAAVLAVVWQSILPAIPFPSQYDAVEATAGYGALSVCGRICGLYRMVWVVGLGAALHNQHLRQNVCGFGWVCNVWRSRCVCQRIVVVGLHNCCLRWCCIPI
jgi:hypothetical protein